MENALNFHLDVEEEPKSIEEFNSSSAAKIARIECRECSENVSQIAQLEPILLFEE